MDPTAAAARSPSHAERSRTVLAAARTGALSTVAREPAGYPFGSLVSYALDDAGRPLLLLSRLAEHTKNLEVRPEASLLVAEPARVAGPEGEPAGDDDDPLARARVTLLGPVVPITGDDERRGARERYLGRHPAAARYVDFGDFGFFRLEPSDVRYVGGFGRMSWVDAAEYRAAEADPLAPAAAGILAHMNADHAAACLDYARALAGIAGARAARMTAVDRYGFELEVDSDAGPRRARLAFGEDARTSETARRELIRLVREAREARTGG